MAVWQVGRAEHMRTTRGDARPRRHISVSSEMDRRGRQADVFWQWVRVLSHHFCLHGSKRTAVDQMDRPVGVAFMFQIMHSISGHLKLKTSNSYYYMQCKPITKRSSSSFAVPMSDGWLRPTQCRSGHRRGRVGHGTPAGSRESSYRRLPCPTLPRRSP